MALGRRSRTSDAPSPKNRKKLHSLEIEARHRCAGRYGMTKGNHVEDRLNQSRSYTEAEIDLLTENLSELLREIDVHLYEILMCAAALSVDKDLAPEDRAKMQAVAEYIHDLAGFVQND